MSLHPAVETWATKTAQIAKKKLEIEDLQQQMSSDMVPLQDQIIAIQADYSSQIATKDSEIKDLETDIKELAI